MTLLRAADRLAAPWKNGLGVTREVAVDPERATLDDFAWRVSLATVHSDGPFSHFADIDRTLAVLHGRLSLTIGGAPHELGPESPPLAFGGEGPVHAQIGPEPVTDLNLMTRRGRAYGVIERLRVTAPVEIAPSPTLLLLTATAGLTVVSPLWEHALDAFDALVLDGEDARSVRLQPSGSTVVYVVRLSPVDEPPRR